MQTTTAIILVGGRGTRLGSLTDNTPKPLLPVAGRPFLLHLLDYLQAQGISKAILSTGYLAEQFDETLGTEYRGIEIQYALEENPLGTGGAIQNALTLCKERRAFVLNGDTLFRADLNMMEALHFKQNALLTIALREVTDVARYGHISILEERVNKMHEKGQTGPGLINGGTYLLEHAVYDDTEPVCEHSFEKLKIPQLISQARTYGLRQDAYFIDIGVPADLAKANRDLA